MFTIALLSTAAQSPSDEGLTFTELLSSLPTDPASLAVLGMLLASFVLVLWTGRRSGGKGGKAA